VLRTLGVTLLAQACEQLIALLTQEVVPSLVARLGRYLHLHQGYISL
jgi:hypothetical protein